MKTMYKQMLLILLFPLIIFGNNGEKYDFKQEKYIKKTYNVNADATLNIENKYGNVNVYLWDENKISIDITIKVLGNNEKKVFGKLNEIDVVFSATQNLVTAKTIFQNSNQNGGNNLSFEINYIVKIPKNGNIDLNNKYGDITVEKLFGTSAIKCQYGSINLGQFSNKSNNITIAYSNHSSIDFIENIVLKSQYSDVNFQNVNQIDISGNYNDFNFQNGRTIGISSNYTKIEAKKIQKLDCNGNYLKLKLGEIGQSATIQSNYSEIQMTTTHDTKSISLDANYTNSKIYCPKDFPFDFDISLKYGNLKTDLNLKFSEKSEKNLSKYYSGYNISSGKSKLILNINYGNVQLLNN